MNHLLKAKKEFTNLNKQEILGDTEYILKNELDIACFLHDMAYGDFADLARRTFSVLRD